jgi:hypothetical protein
LASTVLVRDLIRRVSVLLQDTAPQFERWPEQELVDWLNDAQVAITKFLPAACARVDAIRLRPGTRQSIETIAAADCLPGDGSTTAGPIHGTLVLDVIRGMGADGMTPGLPVRAGSRQIKDTQTPTWHSVTGPQPRTYMFDPRFPRVIYVAPAVPASPSVWVEVAYTAQPIRIPNTGVAGSDLYASAGTSATTISVSDEHVDDLTNYVVARAYLKATEYADANKAALYTGLFTSSLNAKVAVITGHNPNLKQLPLAPEPLAAAS